MEKLHICDGIKISSFCKYAAQAATLFREYSFSGDKLGNQVTSAPYHHRTENRGLWSFLTSFRAPRQDFFTNIFSLMPTNLFNLRQK